MGDVHHLFPGTTPSDVEQAEDRADVAFRVAYDLFTLSVLWNRHGRYALRLARANVPCP